MESRLLLPDDFPSLPPADRVDILCDAFESSYRSGERPQIEDYLSTSFPHDQETLLSELVPLDVEFRQQRGESPTVDEYMGRFPGHRDAVRRAFPRDPESLHRSLDSTVVDQRGVMDVVARSCPPAAPTNLGRYRLLSVIGRGSFGEVWRAHDPDLDRDVALKTLRSDRQYSAEALRSFLEEGRKLARLQHPGVVQVHDAGHDSGRYFIVSELIGGETLDTRLEREGKLPWEAAVALAADVAEALHAAHVRGIVHRDIKSSNILLDARGRPHLADFGLAITEEEQLDEPAAMVGTYAFMPPEQVRGQSRLADARSDIYSLGVVLYRMLTGRFPFVAKTEEQWREQILDRSPRPLRTIDETIPAAVERVCLKCLSKPMADRYTTAGDLAAALRQCLKHRAPRRTLSRVCAAGVTLIIAAGITIGAYQKYRPHPAAAQSLGSSLGSGGEGTPAPLVQGAERPTETAVRVQPVVLNAHPGAAVFHVHYSQDGRYLVSCGSDGYVRVWDLATRQRIAQMQHLTGPQGLDVIDVALLPDTTLCVTACYNGLAVVWDWREGRKVRQFERHRNQVEGVACLGGTRMLSTGWHDPMYIWDAETGDVLEELENSHNGGIRAVAVRADGRRVVTGDYSGQLRLWDLAPGSERLVEPLEPVSESNSVWCIDWVPGTEQIAIGGMCASGEPLLLVYDTVTHHVVRRYSHLTGRVYGVRASRDGQRLFSAADRVHGWSLDDAPDEPLFEFADHRDNAFGVDESPDGTQLATAGTDGTVRIFPWRELTAAARGAGDETGDSLGN